MSEKTECSDDMGRERVIFVQCPVCEQFFDHLLADGPYDGIPCDYCLLKGVKKVLAHGAKTHDSDDKWYDKDWDEHISAVRRHYDVIEEPDTVDRDSGYLSIYHVIARALMSVFAPQVKARYEQEAQDGKATE